MENSFGTGGLFRGPGGDKEPAKTQASGEKSPRFRWDWRLFAAYGCVWIAIFFGLVCVQKVVGVFLEQQRIIQDLIDRQKQWENPDITDDEEERDGAYADLSSWVKRNLPAKGADERPAVSEVFGNLADMLDEGELTGEDDAFSEGVAQLQPVATRSIWLPFLTKLTKRLKKAKYDAAGLAEACRTVSKAIYPQKKAPLALAEGIVPLPESNEPNAQDNKSLIPSPAPVSNEPTEPEQEDNAKTTQAAPANKNCPGGNCPTGYGSGWRWY
jgi:hypothetical protein